MKWTQQQVVCQQELDDGQHWRNITAAGPTSIRRWDNVFSCGRRMRWPALVKRHSANTTLGQCVLAAGVVSSGYETAAKRLITVNLPEAVSTLAKRRRRLASVETASIGVSPLVHQADTKADSQLSWINRDKGQVMDPASCPVISWIVWLSLQRVCVIVWRDPCNQDEVQIQWWLVGSSSWTALTVGVISYAVLFLC